MCIAPGKERKGSEEKEGGQGSSQLSTPGDLLHPGTESRSPALQVDSLRFEPRGKPKNAGVGDQPIPSPGDLPNSGVKRGLPHCRRILYQLSSIPGKPELPYDLAIPFLASFPTKIRYTHPSVHFSIIYNSQYMEAI